MRGVKAAARPAPKPPRPPAVLLAPDSVSLSFMVRNAPPVSLLGSLTIRSTPN